MIITFFLYFMLLFGMMLASYLSVSIFRLPENNFKPLGNIFYYLPIIIYSLFWGLRYNVGTDFQSYEYFYKSIQIKSANLYSIEYGYQLLNEILVKLNFPSSSIFIATSFIVIFLLYRSISRNSKLLPLIIFFYFTTAVVLFSQNGIRQSIAMGFLFIIISCFNEKKYTKSLVLLIIAVLFHKSAIIVALLIVFFKKDIFSNRVLVLMAMFFTFIYPTKLIAPILEQASFIFEILNYNQLARLDKYDVVFEIGSGFGILLKLSLYILTIYLSPYVKNYFKSSPFIIFYNLFIIGIILEPIISQNYFLNRINIYFLSMRIFVYAYTCLYLINNKATKNYFIALFYFIANILFFIASIYTDSNGCGNFQFR